MHQSKRPHMAEYHGFFLFREVKIPLRILTRYTRMMISVKTIPFIMPVIKEIIVKQGGFDKAFLSGTDMKPSVEKKSCIGYTQTMIIGAFISMLYIFTHTLQPAVSGDRFGKPCEVPEFIFGQSVNLFHVFPYRICAFRSSAPDWTREAALNSYSLSVSVSLPDIAYLFLGS